MADLGQQLRERLKGRVCVMGLGNVDLGDDGFFAPRNGTVVAVLFLCALSVAGSIFLILEMDQPFQGLMKISSAPLRYTLSQLGQ